MASLSDRTFLGQGYESHVQIFFSEASGWSCRKVSRASTQIPIVRLDRGNRVGETRMMPAWLYEGKTRSGPLRPDFCRLTPSLCRRRCWLCPQVRILQEMGPNSNGRRVAVTGMGFITPIGNDVETVKGGKSRSRSCTPWRALP
jgi:hypothetical protein